MRNFRFFRPRTKVPQEPTAKLIGVKMERIHGQLVEVKIYAGIDMPDKGQEVRPSLHKGRLECAS